MKKIYVLILFLSITLISNAQVHHNIAVGFSSSGYINAVYQTDIRRIEIGTMLSFNPNLTSFIKHKYKTEYEFNGETININATPDKFLSGTINVMCGGYVGKGFSVGGLLGVNYSNLSWSKSFPNIYRTENKVGVDVGTYLQHRFNRLILQGGYTYRNGVFFNIGVKL